MTAQHTHQNRHDVRQEAGFVRPDREPGATAPEPTILVIADDDGASLYHAAPAVGMRVQGVVSPDAPPERLDDVARVAVIWVADAARIGPALDDRLAKLARAQRAGLVLVTHRADIDRTVALGCAALATDILVDPATADEVVALTRATRGAALAGPVVHDGDERAPALERLDRLQDEVTRIAAALARLSRDDANRLGGGGGDYIGYAVPSGGYAEATGGVVDWGGAVAAPSRGYAGAGMPGAFPSGMSAEELRVRQVRTIIRLRRARDAIFPNELFADPAWDMLLDLYAARLDGKTVSVSSLCIAAAVPATTALRWIRSMTDAGLFLREADDNDRRRVFIALADGAAEAMDRYFTSIGDALPV